MINQRPSIRRAYYPRGDYFYRPLATFNSAPKALPATSPVQENPNKGYRKLALAAVSLLLIFGVFLKTSIISDTSKSGRRLFAASTPKTSPSHLKSIDVKKVSNQVNVIIAQHPELQISVSYTDIKTSSSLHLGVGAPYVAASTAKLLTAALFLHQVEQGQDSLTEQIDGISAQQQLKKMIVDSDNDSWTQLNQRLSDSALSNYAQQIGLISYSHDQNLTTSSDIAKLLTKLYNHKLLNYSHTQLLLSYMQNSSEADFIPSAVPDPIKVYHKAGYLDDRAHDAAIIDDGKRPFVLVVFTKADEGNYNFGRGEGIMHQITSVILNQVQKSESD